MNEILQCLEIDGERLDTEIAKSTGITLHNVRLQLLELASKGEVILCSFIRFVKGEKVEGMKCRLSSERKAWLEQMAGLTWNLCYDAWEHNYKEILEFTNSNGHSRVPIKYISSTGFKLGNWVSEQKFKRQNLSGSQVERLESLPGWTWDMLHNQGEIGFNELLEFIRREGHGRVHARYVTPDGYRLGNWVNTQRTKRHSMSKDRIERLDALPEWIWSARVNINACNHVPSHYCNNMSS